MNHDWGDLIQRQLDGSLVEDEAATLHAALKADASLRQLYLDHANLDHALEAKAASAEVTRELLTLPVPPATKTTGWRSWSRLMAAAAIVLFALLTLWGARNLSSGGVQARVTSGEELPGALPLGESVRLRRLSLSEGKVSLLLENGVEVNLLAPVEVEFVSDMYLKIVRGQVTADVGEHGKGFVIETPQARVLDLGTRFGVDVSEVGTTDVVVFDGLVDLKNRADDTVASLTAGEAVRVESDAARRITMVTTNDRTHDWRVGSDSRTGVITDVRDNVPAPGFHRYYGVTPGGMADGAHAYTNRRHPRWHAQAGEAMPEWLAGADVLGTFSVDRQRKDFAITLTLGRPAAVFVFHDLRKPAPAWLAEGFKDTGARLLLGPWNVGKVVASIKVDGQPAFINCSVWRRDVTAAGNVILGPPTAPGERGQNAMYGIAAKALP